LARCCCCGAIRSVKTSEVAQQKLGPVVTMSRPLLLLLLSLRQQQQCHCQQLVSLASQTSGLLCCFPFLLLLLLLGQPPGPPLDSHCVRTALVTGPGLADLAHQLPSCY
jgi:hypothetical protein